MQSSSVENVHLIASEEANPAVSFREGTTLQVTRVKIVQPDMRESAKVGARLCGGDDTCIAIIELKDPQF